MDDLRTKLTSLGLNETDIDVALLRAQGKQIKQCAEILGVTPKIVCNHIGRINRLLGLKYEKGKSLPFAQLARLIVELKAGKKIADVVPKLRPGELPRGKVQW